LPGFISRLESKPMELVAILVAVVGLGIITYRDYHREY